MSPRQALLLLPPLAFACKPGAPLSANLAVESATTAQAESAAFRVVEGDIPGTAGDVVEQKGVVGSGENCVIARQSSGTLYTTLVYEQQQAYNVVGETEADLPLVPGEQEEWSRVPVSVVKASSRLATWSEARESFVDPSPDAEVVQWDEVRYDDGNIVTTAGFHGVAADEFVVRIEMADLWDDLEDLDATDIQLMTRHEPQKGDVWPSVNGNSLFVYQGHEPLTVGGTTMKKADKVAIYATGNADWQSGIFEQCLYLGLNQLQTTDPNVESSSIDKAILDPGCVGSFVHVQEGTEWWYHNVLVKSEAEQSVVNVRDYGFEWFVEDEASGSCTRQTSLTRDDPTAKLFVEYTVTLTTVTQQVSSFTE